MKILLVAAVLGMVGGTTAAHADNHWKNWGQEVKDANHTGGYGEGVSRGEYVREQANNESGPGYALEIHQKASPGKSDPQAHKF
jgi:hypothetical protein